ncbi:S8 family serine peptidase [Streptomyces sp. NBC_01285]|uniref:S8 family serine peptidase n=1 Tax=Streptomyces sp. NBC_01285 TaxID=2903813 RepID=UPI00225BEE90|nr:S8 family serine peptidase [Streptomyces sp. NBC_01285]MCX4770291.1 S8 family serine peptidase [Streptomyces sp. NBC_01285]
MTPQPRRASRIRRGTIGALLTTTLAALGLPLAAPATAAGPAGPLAAGAYLVTLADQPLVTYDGSIDDIPATRPVQGRKLDVTTADAKRYRAHLIDEQAHVAKTVGATVRQHYAVTTNTFSAQLNARQLVRLAATKGVTGIAPDRLHHATDDKNSTDFLGLSGRKGLWASLGGSAKAGKGIVIGDIDTGIWPESASFKAPALTTRKPTGNSGKKPTGKPAKDDRYRPYRDGTTTVMHKADGATFTGTCQTGDGFTAADCNEKIISARYFAKGWLQGVPESNRAGYISPRDSEGHGTHTASTAAGNANVRATVGSDDFGAISGVAPAAAVAVYKALWESKDGTQSGGLTSDLVAAIDQAVADGVDVINYSLGAQFESDYDDPSQTALRNAAAAGVFVATAGGNAGPDASSLDNTAPWTTTVAAGTIAPYTGTVTLGNGKSYAGISTSVHNTVGSAPLVRAAAVKAAGADTADADLCVTGTLDPALAAGKIVVCDRGTIARADKSAEVKRVGGLGMVLVNIHDDSTDGDLHSVPTVHLNVPEATTVRDYAATGKATATLTRGGTGSATYPQVTGFSSRGPSLAGNGDLLKPDITAPGATILAAVAPPGNHGRDFDFYSGTSMATPHIAGLAALYFSEHPTWSPMSIKSAMMTTASPTKTSDGKNSDDVFAQGAGEVEARTMLRPGLVYDSTERDWLAYLEGVGIDTRTGTKAIDPSDLNYPSIAIGELFGTQTVTRTVIATSAGTYRAKVDLPGIKAKVSPSVLHFSHAGQKRTFTVKLDVTTARAGAVDTGSLTWTSGRTTVRSPIVVTPQSVHAPAEVKGTGTDGENTYSVTPATDTFVATAYGPVSSPLTKGTLTGTGEIYYEAAVPAGTKASQISVHFDLADGNIGGVVWGRMFDGALRDVAFADVDSSGTATINLPQPDAEKIFVAVVALDETGTGESVTPYTYQANNITENSPATGTVTVAPGRARVTPGAPIDLTAAWSGVPSDARSTAWIEYSNGAGTFLTLN